MPCPTYLRQFKVPKIWQDPRFQNTIIEYNFTLLNTRNTNRPSVLSLLGTYRFKATAGLILLHATRDGLSHGIRAKAMHEAIVHTKIQTVQIIASLFIPFSFCSPFGLICSQYPCHNQTWFSPLSRGFLSLHTSLLQSCFLKVVTSIFFTSSAFSLMHLPPADETKTPSSSRYTLLTGDITLLHRLMPPSAELTCEVI